jgi:hypothetical protein
MRRLQQSPPEAQRRCDVNGRIRFCPEASLQKMRRSNRANSRTLQAHHLKSMTKKTTLKELGDMLSHVVKHMATKDDLADLRKEMATKDDIADVKSTLADHTKILNDHTRDLAIIKKDLTTNLDKRLQLEVRVSAVEKHLGLDKKIAA